MTGYIYKITNITNNKIYIGQTCRSINLRWLDHCYASKYPSHKDYECPLHRAIRKYGNKNFKVEEIDTASSLEELNEKEIYYIQKYNSYKKGYNASLGGFGHCKYDYEKIKDYFLTHNYSIVETCKFFKIYDQVVYNALKIYNIDYKNLVRTNIKRSKVKKKYILCVETGKIFTSMSEIDKFFQKKASPNIRRCLNGITEKAYGYHWKESESLDDLLYK